jgi:hypothetical protein
MNLYMNIVNELLKLINRIFPSPRHQVEKIVNIYDQMHRIIEETPVERFLIFKSHNGGGVIKPNTPLYSSVIYEDYTAPFKSVKDVYQRIEADEEYLRMLVEMIQKKSIILKTEKLPPGLLKNIYKAEGVKYAEKYFLGTDKKNIYYCSCGTSVEGGWENNAYQKNAIYMAINIIKQNIK